MTDAKLTFVHALIFDLDGTLIDSKQDSFPPCDTGELGREELAEETISGYIGHGAPQLAARAPGMVRRKRNGSGGGSFFRAITSCTKWTRRARIPA
jgi:phosphoglycolate phosphatase-like HAD superfamily hydrolase